VNCVASVERLSADLDGELAAAEAVDLRRHLALCPECSRKHATLDQARAAFRGTAPERRAGGYARVFVLAAALTILVTLGNLLVRRPAPRSAITNATAGIDCGLPDGDCLVADPCRDQRCSAAAAGMLAGLQ
jgi:anti-sigma factor RsiW